MKDHTSRVLSGPPAPRFREGIVVTASPLTVSVAGSTIPASRLAINLNVGQRVLVLFDMGAAIVLGRIVND